MEERIRQFIIDTFAVDGQSGALTADTPLIESGIMDSMGVVEVVEFLEDEFGIEVDDDEIVPENMNSIGGLVQFVAAKQAALSGAGIG